MVGKLYGVGATALVGVVACERVGNKVSIQSWAPALYVISRNSHRNHLYPGSWDVSSIKALAICSEGAVTLHKEMICPLIPFLFLPREEAESNVARPVENESRVAHTPTLPQLCRSACHPTHQQLINDNM